MQLKIDQKEVINYLYTPREVEALLKGGVQRLYVGNLKVGAHELVAFFNGKGPNERAYKRGASLQVREGRGREVPGAEDRRPAAASCSRSSKSRTGNKPLSREPRMRALLAARRPGAAGAARPAQARRHDPEKLPETRIRDLHYGDVLFYYLPER